MQALALSGCAYSAVVRDKCRRGLVRLVLPLSKMETEVSECGHLNSSSVPVFCACCKGFSVEGLVSADYPWVLLCWVIPFSCLLLKRT